MASHDGTYSIDFNVTTFRLKTSATSSDSEVSGASTPADSALSSLAPISKEELPGELTKFVIHKLSQYRQEHLYKFVGAGINEETLRLSPQLAARLWQELDIVPLILPNDSTIDRVHARRSRRAVTVDEEADSMVRKALV